MHRQLLGLDHGDPRHGDHINRDRLDNRRENLRIVTGAQNQQNRGAHKQSKTGIRGVFYDRFTGRYRVLVSVEKRKHHIGRFDTIEEAEAAAIEARQRLMPFAVN